MRARIEQFAAWLHARDVDVALVQETKCSDEVFPFDAITSLGYEVAHFGLDHWNGVAVVSRVGINDVHRGFRSDKNGVFEEARIMGATCGGVRCWSVYVPNGRSLDDPHFDYKLRWLDQLASEMMHENAADQQAIVAGDFNVGLADIDFYDADRWRGQKHATDEERQPIEAILDLGLIDAARQRYPSDPMFTWWNYNAKQFGRDRGLRIDLALISPSVHDLLDDVWVDRPTRDPLACAPATPSDHAPLILDLRS